MKEKMPRARVRTMRWIGAERGEGEKETYGGSSHFQAFRIIIPLLFLGITQPLVSSLLLVLNRFASSVDRRFVPPSRAKDPVIQRILRRERRNIYSIGQARRTAPIIFAAGQNYHYSTQYNTYTGCHTTRVFLSPLLRCSEAMKIKKYKKRMLVALFQNATQLSRVVSNVQPKKTTSLLKGYSVACSGSTSPLSRSHVLLSGTKKPIQPYRLRAFH